MSQHIDAFGTELVIGDHVAFSYGLNCNTLQRGIVVGFEVIKGMTMIQIVVDRLDGSTDTVRHHSSQVVRLS